MEFIHDRKGNILFSLQGSKVNRIKFHNKTLTLTADEMYQLVDGEEKAFPGEICFKSCDVNVCNVLIFNKTLCEGRFYGKSLCLRDFLNEYADSEFEIITEGYLVIQLHTLGGFGKKEKLQYLPLCIFGKQLNFIFQRNLVSNLKMQMTIREKRKF